MSASPPRRESSLRELLAVEGRALEQVGELGAVARVVELELLVPRARSTSGRASLGRLRVLDRLLRGLRARRKPSGCSRSSARCASRPAVRARIGTAFTDAAGKPRSSITAAIGMRDVHRQRLAPDLGHGVAERAGERDVRAARRRARLRARGSARRAGRAGLWTGWPKPGTLPPAAWISRAISARRLASEATQPASSSRAHSSDVPSTTGPGAEDPRRDGALQRVRVGGERHPGGDVGRHHPVLGDRDEQEVEEEALLLGRLLAGEQQVEVLGEASAGPSGRR